jgi:anaerobic ribonucleoside-triphosphate reductase activating protein
MQNFAQGLAMPVKQLAGQICHSATDGLTIVGGEPLEQLKELNCLLDELAALGYAGDIIIFSGFNWSEIKADAGKLGLVKRCDLLIAGPYKQSLAPDSRKWIGSRNQTLHFFSDEFNHLKDRWPQHKKEIEIHISNGQVSINGFPLGKNSEFEKLLKTGEE